MNQRRKASAILFISGFFMWLNIGAGYIDLFNRVPRGALGHALAALCAFYFVRVGEKSSG